MNLSCQSLKCEHAAECVFKENFVYCKYYSKVYSLYKFPKVIFLLAVVGRTLDITAMTVMYYVC